MRREYDGDNSRAGEARVYLTIYGDCNHTFQGWSETIIQLLGEMIQISYPAHCNNAEVHDAGLGYKSGLFNERMLMIRDKKVFFV